MTACKFTSTTTPRVVLDRHAEDCRNDLCPGCQPCPEDHCRVDGHTHVRGITACAECVAEAREYLRGIGRMCDALPDEVESRGVDGEAMVLLGPAANPEARAFVESSYRSGRLPEGWIEAAHGKDCPRLWNEACTGCAGGELHPLTILGTWEMVWRAELDHDEVDLFSIAESIDYIDRTLSYMSSWPHVPFEDFARDIRRCATHLEAVLHDGEQRDTGAPCMTCKVPLEREWGRLAAADGWRCPRCREWRSDVDYRLNVADLHNERADWLTDRDMEVRTGVKSGTVRSWARDGRELVARKQDSGRVLYSVADVLATARRKGLVA